MPSRSDEGKRLLRTVRVLTAGVKMINRLLNRRVLCCASLLLALSATAGHAQDTAPPMRASAVYVELLGNGGVYSVNYERALTPAVRVRVGAASWTTDSFWSDAETRIQTFPITLHVVSGGGAHHLETGIGVLPGHRGRDRDFGMSGGFVSLIAFVGYRFEPPPRRFVFRAGFTPFYGFGDPSVAYPEQGFLPSLGFSFGARF